MSRPSLLLALSLAAAGSPVAPGATQAPPAAPHAGWARGLDVSHHQGTIDWPTVASSGIHFAFVKATEGVDWKDPNFDVNWAATGSLGMLRGAYHMLRPEDDAVAQAEFFLAVLAGAGSRPHDLPPALDVERVSSTDTVPRHQVAERALEWLRHVEARVGRRPLLYTNPTFWRDYLAADHPLTDYPLWLAEYASEAPPEAQYGWSGWQFWQFSQRGKRPGVPLPVDLNLYHGTHDELRSALTRRPP